VLCFGFEGAWRVENNAARGDEVFDDLLFLLLRLVLLLLLLCLRVRGGERQERECRE
jgi:hypothetical protein